MEGFRYSQKSKLVSPGDPDEMHIYYEPDWKSAKAKLWTSFFSPFMFGEDGVPDITVYVYYFSDAKAPNPPRSIPKLRDASFLSAHAVDNGGTTISLSRTSRRGLYLLLIKIREPIISDHDGWFDDTLELMAHGSATGLSISIK